MSFRKNEGEATFLRGKFRFQCRDGQHGVRAGRISSQMERCGAHYQMATPVPVSAVLSPHSRLYGLGSNAEGIRCREVRAGLACPVGIP